MSLRLCLRLCLKLGLGLSLSLGLSLGGSRLLLDGLRRGRRGLLRGGALRELLLLRLGGALGRLLLLRLSDLRRLRGPVLLLRMGGTLLLLPVVLSGCLRCLGLLLLPKKRSVLMRAWCGYHAVTHARRGHAAVVASTCRRVHG